ncbi:importin-4-like [Lycorma delicatula]|uniref:importin-4-like n=1 Tax=Lycorma delicatula TaxID=130591 RepID=UPI003F510AA7
MENILGKLLAAETVQEGTKELREAFKNPEAVSALCVVVVSSPNPQIRQYAAVLLRRRLTKARYWSRLPIETRNSIKQGMLEALIKEPEKPVKNSVAQLIGIITRHEFPNQSWPELLQCLQVWTNSENTNDKELGFYTLSVLSDVATDQFLVHAQLFGFLFISTLRSLTDLACPVAYLTVVCMTHFVPTVDGDQAMVNLYHEAMPRVLEVIKALSRLRPDRAVEAMELLDELLENATTVLVPHLKLAVSVCLELAVDRTVGLDLPIKALSFIGNVIRIKKKAVVKHELVQPILSVLFRLISMPPDDEDQEKYFADDDDNSTPITCANQILDTMALHLPPEKVIPPLLQYIQPGLEGNDLYMKKAAYLSMAMLSEGCSDYIRTKHLEQFLRYVCKGITEQASVVRNAALFALGQFSEYLQPEISCYAQELLPVLFEFLSRLQGAGDSEPQGGVDRMFYALEMFCENLGDALLPYLPTLMERLLPLLVPPHSVTVRELAISAVGSAANAAKEGMLPYFSRIMVCLKQYLIDDQSDDTMCLQVQAVDTLGVLARTIGEENFLPLARESIELGLNLMSKTDDPDLRKSCYGLFASVSSVMKENMAEVLPQILEPMITAVKSGDGIVFHYKEDENNAFPVYEDLSDTADEEDIDHESDISEDEDVAAYTVENAYVEEKEEACVALREIAENTGSAFLPYLEKSFDEVLKLLTYPQDDIRKAAVGAVTQFIINFSKIETDEGKQALHKAMENLIPKCAEMVRMDGDREVVMTALNSFKDLLKQVGAPTIAAKGHTDLILNSVIDIMTHRTECQDKGEDDEPEAEQDEVLVESAGEIVPHLGKALGPVEFSQHYTQLLPHFLTLTKPKCSDAQRSFGVGMIAECMEPLGERVTLFVAELFPFLISLTRDKNDDVRNNSIFALGEMALHGKNAVFELYPQLLQALSTAVSSERNALALDNICGAIARLIVTNISGVPLDQVLPVYVNFLPLREDFEENKWVFKSFELMYQLGTESMRKLILPVIKTAVLVLHKDQIEQENKDMVVNLIKMCYRDFPSECATAATELPPDVAVTLQQICSS